MLIRKESDTIPFEKKTQVTFSEFKAWLHGLIEGKKGGVPDTEDWKRIKTMMDKVVPDIYEVSVPTYPSPSIPWWKWNEVSTPTYPSPSIPWNPLVGSGSVSGNHWLYNDGGHAVNNLPLTSSGSTFAGGKTTVRPFIFKEKK